MTILISLLVVICVVIVFYFLTGKLPKPLDAVGQVIVIGAGAIWLIAHIPEIVHAIAGK